jgi:ribosomal protein S18 acetylase RimI-like enzyme
VRPALVALATPSDREAVLALFEASVPVVFRDLLEEPLRAALRGSDEELCAVARDREAGALTGFVLFGFVAGADGAGRIRAVGVAPLARRRGVGRALVETAVAELRDQGARLVLVELPDTDEAHFVSVLLAACQFEEEARAARLVSDGIDMRYVVRRLAPPPRAT